MPFASTPIENRNQSALARSLPTRVSANWPAKLSFPVSFATDSTSSRSAARKPSIAVRWSVATCPPPKPFSDITVTNAPLAMASRSAGAMRPAFGCLPSRIGVVLPAVTPSRSGPVTLSARMVASGASPCMPVPLRAAAAIEATLLPWPSLSSMAKGGTVSPGQVAQRAMRCSKPVLSAEMRPANSGEDRAIPLSMTAIVTPLPVIPRS